MTKMTWMASILVLALVATAGGVEAQKREGKNSDEEKKPDKKEEQKEEKPTRTTSDEKSKENKGGTLDSFEKEVKDGPEGKEKGGKKGKKHESHSHDCSCGSCDVDPFTLFMAEMIWQGTQALLVGTPAEFHHPKGYREPFSRYPYRRAGDGLYAKGAGKPLALDLGANYFYSREDLTGWEVKGRLSPLSFLTLEGKFTRLTERRGFGLDSNLEFGNLFLNFNRVRTNVVVLYWGAGLRYMGGNRDYTGFAFDVGTEIYPVRPISLSAQYVGSWLNGEYVPEFTGTVNLHLGRAAVFVGYQNWTAGDVTVDGVVSGVKVFF